MADFKQGALVEIELLMRELDQITSRQRVIELKLAALNAYLSAEEAGTVVRSKNTPASGSVKRPLSNSQKKSNKDQIIGAVLRILADDIPRRTEQLVALLLEDGVAIGGANKLTSVSSILSRDNKFRANRKEGWTLNKESLAANEAFDLQPTP